MAAKEMPIQRSVELPKMGDSSSKPGKLDPVQQYYMKNIEVVE